MGRFLASLILLCVVASVQGQIQGFTATSFTLPPRPSLTGGLEPNNFLYTVEKIHSGKYKGSVSFAYLNGDIFTVTSDGKVINIAKCEPEVIANLAIPGCTTTATCGMLTDIRPSIDGQLLVVDAYRGIFQVNPVNRQVTQIFSSQTPVAGRVSKYLNGIVQSPSGIIYVSDSSDKYEAINDIYIIMDGSPSGRIFSLDPSSGIATEVTRNTLAYPNGMEMSLDGKHLLVAESGRARVIDLNLEPGAIPFMTIFADNLPGCPTNIRRSPYNTFWVGLSLVRHSGAPSSMDQFSNNPQARENTVRTDSREQIKSYYLKYGLTVELNEHGSIIGSLHDPSGKMYSAVPEASEIDGILYIGSTDKTFTGMFVLPQSLSNNDTVMQLSRVRCQITEQQFQNYRQSKTTTTNTGTTI